MGNFDCFRCRVLCSRAFFNLILHAQRKALNCAARPFRRPSSFSFSLGFPGLLFPETRYTKSFKVPVSSSNLQNGHSNLKLSAFSNLLCSKWYGVDSYLRHRDG